jgi:hypothetical protein
MTGGSGRTAITRALAGAAALLALAIPFASGPASAQEGAFDEAAVKAAYLYHFATFVDWPEQPAPGETLSIAVLDDVAVFEQLEQFLPGRTIDGMAVSARLVRSMDEFDEDEILYIGRTDNRKLDNLLADTVPELTGCLVVIDATGGIRPGAAINFIYLADRIRFEIDRDAAAQSGLRRHLRQTSCRCHP